VRRVVQRGDAAGRLDAVHQRHAHVHQHHVGVQFGCQGNGFGAVGRLAHHAEVVAGVDHHAEAGAHQGLVVGDQHADHPAVAAIRTIRPASATRIIRAPPR
jgi:hypothetical protein